MYNIFLMNCPKPIDYLPEDVESFGLTKFSSLSLDIDLEIRLTIFQEEIKMVFSFGWFVESRVMK